jgi:DNA modification methylase
MPTLPSVGAIITDPPYNVTEVNGRDGTKPGKVKRKDGSYAEVVRNFGDWDRNFSVDWFLNLAFEILPHRGNLIAFTSDRLLSNYISGPMKHMRTMLWRKTNSPGSFNANYISCVEFAVWLSKEAPGVFNGSRSLQPIFDYPSVHGKHRLHPTQKPLKLMDDIVRLHTNESFAVLDPFMGSGTTGVSSLSAGRTFIGIESCREHFYDACRRIESCVTTHA